MITILPKNLIAHSYSLHHLGINNIGWTYNNINNVIEYLVEHNYIILGGDVYRLNGDIIKATYDSWYIDTTNLDNIVLKGKTKAISYINNYQLQHGNHYLYSLVFEKKV